MLSNTATPYYYGLFRDAVMRGEIPVNREIEMQMNRIDDDIRNPQFYYDPLAINGYVAFCEQELTLTDGSDLLLLQHFKLWAEDIFSWFYFEERPVFVPDGHGRGHYEKKVIKRRLRNKQYLVVGRSNAKTLYDESIHAYGLVADRETTHQITTAPTMNQAEEVLGPFRTAIARARGPVFQMLTEGSLQNTTGNRANRQKLASTKKGIENLLTNSLLEVKPMAIDKLQGLRVKYSTVDEWLSGNTREDPIGAIEQGAAKIKDYLIVATSSEGTVRNGIGDTMKIELMKILKGEYYDPHTSIWYYKLDSVDEVSKPAYWMKANPGLLNEATVTYDTIQRDVERAEANPAARNDILAKRFGIPMEGYTYFFTYEETRPHQRQYFWQLPCALGADLSQGDDFCAFTFMFPLGNGKFGVKTRSYISSRTFIKLPEAARNKYENFINEGSLMVLEGTILDMMDVYDDLETFIENNQYDVRTFGYDPYNAKAFVERWVQEYGEYGIAKVIQGAKTESVPLGELKQMAEDRLLVFDEELMQFAMGNCIVLEDTNGNRKLYKARREEKIDNVAAMLDAFVSYKLFKEAFE